MENINDKTFCSKVYLPLFIIIDASKKTNKDKTLIEINKLFSKTKKTILMDHPLKIYFYSFNEDIVLLKESEYLDCINGLRCNSNGSCNLAKSFNKLLDEIDRIKQYYKKNEIEYFMPNIWIFLDSEINDLDSDDYRTLKERAIDLKQNKKMPVSIIYLLNNDKIVCDKAEQFSKDISYLIPNGDFDLAMDCLYARELPYSNDGDYVKIDLTDIDWLDIDI